MKRFCTLVIMLIMLASIFLMSCTSPEPEAAPTTPVTPTPTQPAITPFMPTSPETPPAQPPAVQPVAPAPPEMQPQSGGSLVIMTNLSPTVMGYSPGIFGRETFFTYPCIENLITYGPDLSIQPLLCESYAIIPDGPNCSVTFYLRKGIKFHDGTELNAEIAKWNLQLMIDENAFSEYDDIKSMTVVNDYALRLNLSKYSNTMLHGMTFASRMLSKAAFDANGGKEWANDHPVGTGPFMMDEFSRGTTLKYKAFPDYWGEGPYLDTLEFRTITDPTVAAAMMEAGQADVWAQADMKEALDLSKKGLIPVFCQGAAEGIMPDGVNPGSILSNKDLRLAVEYAIDRDAIAKAVDYGAGVVPAAYQEIFPGDPGYKPDYGRKYDPAKAKEYLAKAGYPDGFETNLYVFQASARYKDVAAAVQAYCAAVGIKMNIEFMSPGAYFGARLRGWKDGYFMAGDPREPYAPAAGSRHWACKPPEEVMWNHSRGRTPEICAQHDVMRAAPNDKAQLEEYIKLAYMVDDEALWTPLYYFPDIAVVQPWAHTTWIQYSTKVYQSNLDWVEPHE